MYKLIPKIDDEGKGRGGELIMAAIRNYLRAEKIKAFELLESREDQIQFLLDNKAQIALLQTFATAPKKHNENVIGDTDVKDKVLAKHLRDAGNSAFCSGDDATALDCYNQSIILAPFNTQTMTGEDLSIAAANRAAVFLRQEKFTHCLKDIELALDTGYPKKLRHKLYQRHAKCLCEMYRFSEALKIFELAIDALEDSTLNKDQKESTKKELEASADAIKLKHGLEKALKAFTKDPENAIPEEFSWKRPILDTDPSLPNFSSELESIIDPENQEQRIMVKSDRAECIKAISVLGVEDSAIHYLTGESRITNCSHCTCNVLVPVPCPGCIHIVFCSINCRNIAWNTYHKYECEIPESIRALYQEVFLAYRVICQIPFDKLLGNKTYLLRTIEESRKERDNCQENNGHADLENMELFSLCSHSNETLSTEQKLKLGTCSTILLHYLKENSYFGKKLPTSLPSEHDVFVSTLLYHLLQVTQYNAQLMYEVGNWTITTGVKLNTIGLVINPSLSLVNHSCDPNAVRINYGKTSLLISTKNIHPGTEVCVSYSINFQDVPQMKRQEFLKQYFHFDCHCIPCSFNWPLQRDIKTSVAKRGMANKANEIKFAYANTTKLTMHDMQGGYFDRVARLWAEFYEQSDKILQQPHKCFIKAVEEISNSLWLKYGNRVPRLKAPPYKDHTKEVKNKSDEE